jgi:hypothetical protein
LLNIVRIALENSNRTSLDVCNGIPCCFSSDRESNKVRPVVNVDDARGIERDIVNGGPKFTNKGVALVIRNVAAHQSFLTDASVSKLSPGVVRRTLSDI